jgi:hypothetical protein
MSGFAYHDEIGSKLTPRNDVFDALLDHVISQADAAERDQNLRVVRYNLLALYTYLRIATTCGLRPVRKPFPPIKDFDQANGAFSVADKRSHHKEERRLIVLSSSLNDVLIACMQAATALSVVLDTASPDSLLMTFDTKSLSWQHFSRKFVNSALHKITGEQLMSHSLRHIAARRFATFHIDKDTFSQAALNLHLNHNRKNASALNQRSMADLASLISHQRHLIDAYDGGYSSLDGKALKLLQQLFGESI